MLLKFEIDHLLRNALAPWASALTQNKTSVLRRQYVRNHPILYLNHVWSIYTQKPSLGYLGGALVLKLV